MHTKRDFGNDPTVQAILAETAALLDKQTEKLRVIARRRGMTDEPSLPTPKVGWWKPDPNPWPGKVRVPEMLLRMLLEDARWITDFPSCAARHDAMVDEACKRAALTNGHEWRPGNTYSYSAAWTTPLAQWSMRNCKAALVEAGYKPPKAANTLTAFVRLIEAGRHDKAQQSPADRSYDAYGEHPHELRFYSGTEFSYAGRAGNVQWRKGSKSCEPINGSATAYFSDEPRARFALRAFLMKAKAITPEQWPEVQQAAQRAKMRADAAYARGHIASIRAEQRRAKAEDECKITAELDASGLFAAETPERFGREDV